MEKKSSWIYYSFFFSPFFSFFCFIVSFFIVVVIRITFNSINMMRARTGHRSRSRLAMAHSASRLKSDGFKLTAPVECRRQQPWVSSARGSSHDGGRSGHGFIPFWSRICGVSHATRRFRLQFFPGTTIWHSSAFRRSLGNITIKTACLSVFTLGGCLMSAIQSFHSHSVDSENRN